MTLDELAAKMEAGFAAVHKKMDEGFDAVDDGFDAVDRRFDAVDRRFDAVDKRFAAVDERFSAIDVGFAAVDGRFAGLDEKMDEGFKDSKIRDEELRGLMKLGLEANEILREDVSRRFDATDQNHDEQIGLLKDVARHLSSHK